MRARLAAAVAGVLAALLVLELALRLAGATADFAQHRDNPRLDFKPDEFRVVVLGESTSAQIWSGGREFSWAGQLQERLNSAGLGRRFKLINLAQNATSSAFLTRDFESAVNTLKPHAVVAMMGVNDHVGLDYLREGGWGSLRLVKALRWRAALGAQDRDAARALRDASIARHAESARSFPECRRLALRSLALNPRDNETVRHLLHCTEPLDEAGARETLAALRAALAAGLEPSGSVCTLLADFPPLDPELLEKTLADCGVRLEPGRSSMETTARAYRALASLARSKGFALIAMQYPTARVDALRNLFANRPRLDFKDYPSSFYAEFPGLMLEPEYADVLFVANENFSSAVARGKYSEFFTDRFAPGGRFGHCTDKGHALIAENAEAAILGAWPRLAKP